MHMPVTRELSLRFEEVRDMNRFRLALGGALLCIFVLGGRGAHADDAAKPAEPAKPTAPSLIDVLTASGVDLHGYVDVAYSYLSGTGIFTSRVADRVFDTEPNSFNVHQAALTIDYQPKEGFGGLVNLIAGRDARVIASAPPRRKAIYCVPQRPGRQVHSKNTQNQRYPKNGARLRIL